MTKPLIPPVVILPVLILLAVFLLWGVLRRKTGPLSKVVDLLRLFLILGLIFLVNLRPMTRRFHMDVELKNIDVLFVTDTTISMWAMDYSGEKSRMNGVIADTEHVIEQLSGSNFALIRFDNRSQILAPFTQDADNVRDAFYTIREPDRYYAKGSSLNTPFDDMEDLLISSNGKKERQTVVFFISDGEITDDSELRSYAELAKYVDGGAVLGYGTARGGKMYDSYGSVIRDYSGQYPEDAVSVIDEDNLRKIAADLGVDYIHMDNPANIEYMIDAIKTGSSFTMDSDDAISYEEVYFYFVIPLAILLLWELAVVIRRGRI